MIAHVHSMTLLQEPEISSTHQREQAATPETAPPPAERRCLIPYKSGQEDVQPLGQREQAATPEDVLAPDQTGTTTRPFQTILSHFSDDLRDRYAKYPLPHHSNPQCRKWMPHISKKYIHPDIISKEEQEEQPDSHKEAVLRGQRWRLTEEGSGGTVQLAELLEARSGENRNVILVEGGPGMGKSTLAWQVCHYWGRRELFSQYSTVLLLPLRDERVQQAKHVEDLFFYLEDQREVIRELGTGKETVVILDGLDELPSHLLSKQSLFTDLLSGEVLCDATILVTSRPSATQQLLMCWKQRILKHFIIQGFNEGDIKEYVKSILSSEKLTEFQRHLSIHPHIQSIMYVPLHSAIVMAIYLQHKQLPTTRTELYMALVETILSQYLDDHPECRGEEEVSCAIGLELPKHVYAQFMQLCKIAFDTACRQELIFCDKTMPKVLHDLGFTDSVPGLYMHRTCSYNFLHLSIQEFLAAYHVSLLSPQEQEQLLLRSHKEYHIKNMVRFVAGITKFEGIRKEVMKQVVVTRKHEINDNYYYHYLEDYGLELLYECQSMSVLDKEDIYYSSWFPPAHEWLALGYCIVNSKCVWNLNFKRADVNAQMLLQGLQDCKTQPAYTIKSIYWQLYNSEVYRKLLDFNTHTESMILGNRRNQSHLTHFWHWLPTCHLKTLSFSVSEPDNIEMILGALNAVPSLKTLCMKWTKFTLHSMQAFASMLQQNQTLIKVDISECKMGSVNACCLARALYSNTTLTVLIMKLNSVGEKGALAMAEMLKHNTTLTELDMSWNSVGERGALAMAEVLKHNTTLTVLKMTENSVGEKGALAMAEMLKHNTTLTELDMCWNSVGERGALAMAETLKHNTTLTVLNMGHNSVGERGALAMAEMLKHNITLEELNMFSNHTPIGDEGVKALVESLAVNHHLKRLHVYISADQMTKMRALPAYHASKERIWLRFFL